ncbi:MAG: hypothetical protein IJU19_06640, partial [Bacteroidales bacterium]|nr:hypothetical protein [Bacteroidales bacterium]
MVVVASISATASRAQGLGAYVYSTGVDAAKWITITNTTNLLNESGDAAASSLKNIGFTFPFGGSTYTQYSVTVDGILRIGSDVADENVAPYYPLGDEFGGVEDNNPKITGFGGDGYAIDGVHHVYAQTFGNLALVVEFSIGTFTSQNDNSNSLKWQVQLFADGTVRIVYASTTPSPLNPENDYFQVGMCISGSDGWIVDADHVATHFNSDGSNDVRTTWPGANRYYTFLPICTGTLPYSENFDSYSGTGISTGSGYPSTYPNHLAPTCWHYPALSATSGTYPAVYITSYSYFRNGASGNGIRFQTNSRHPRAVVVLAKDFGLPNSRLAFSFDLKVNNASHMMEYGVMSNPADTSTFIPLGYSDYVGWKTITDTLSKYADRIPAVGTLYLAFRESKQTAGEANYSGGLDNVSVRRWCDSTTQNVTACESYTWAENSTTYTETGIYRKVYTNAHGGCDSTVRLNLTIN